MNAGEHMFLDNLDTFTVVMGATDPPTSGVDRYLALCAIEDARNPVRPNTQGQRIMDPMEDEQP